MLFEDNIGSSLSMDETALSNGELYTKKAKGGKKYTCILAFWSIKG